MMIDLTGHTYGRFTVKSFSHRDSNHSFWTCRCACGNDRVVSSNHLRTGHTKSCGCQKSDGARQRIKDRKNAHDAVALGRRARLRAFFSYDPDTGVVSARLGYSARKAGDICGFSQDGYLVTTLDKEKILLHRLAWFLHYAELLPPSIDIDHKDRNGFNNKITNLRKANRTQNNVNSKVRKDSKTGVKGVRERGKRFVAIIRKDGISKHIGTFDTKEEASAAYAVAALELFGEFARAA